MNYRPISIIPDSVDDIYDEEIDGLINSLSGTNYVVSCSLFKFKFDGNEHFNVADIEHIYQEPRFFTLILKSEIDQMYEDINEIFYYGDCCDRIIPGEIATQRINIFWNIINKQLESPIIKAFKCKFSKADGIYYNIEYVILGISNGIYLNFSSYD